MKTMPQKQFGEVLSKSRPKRKIELEFVLRLAQSLGQLSELGLQDLAVSGKFNAIFPPLADEGPVAGERFADLKPFNYSNWAKRHQVKPAGKPARGEPKLA